MTETPADPPGAPPSGGATATAPPPPPPPPPAPVPLVRPREGRVFRGVCAGLGRHTRTDPVLWRVLVVVLTVLGGSGLVLYLAGWLLVPEEGAAESEGQRLVRGSGPSSGAVLAAVVLGLLLWFAVLDEGRALLTILVVGVLALLVARGRREAPPPPGPVPSGAAAWGAPPAWSDPAPAAWGPPGGGSAPPLPPAPRNLLLPLVLSAVAVVVGTALLGVVVLGTTSTATTVLATALLVIGLGIVVGSRWGRAGGLIVIAALLSAVVVTVDRADAGFGGEAGERTWTVDGSASHRLAVGSGVLDLRPLAGTARRGLVVEAQVGAGELLVLVPEDLRVAVDGSVGLGELTTVDVNGVERTEDGTGLSRQESLGPVGSRQVALDLRVGVGELEVRVVRAS